MAVRDSENPPSSGTRLSPGDAAFERLRQREALKVRDDAISAPELQPAMLIGPPINPALSTPAPTADAAAAVPQASSESVPPATPAGVAPARAPAARPAEAQAAEPADRILAMAAAFGIAAPPDAAAPDEPEESPAPTDIPALLLPATNPEPAPAPALVAPAPPPPLRDATPPPSPPAADATAARLEAALLDQLRTLEETLVGDAPGDPAPRLPRAAPLRPATKAPRPVAPEAASQRSVFAPDPVRQRTYVDLRSPAPEREPDASSDPPWRKYLAEPQRRDTAGRPPPHRRAVSPAGRPAPTPAVAHGGNADVGERGRGFRAMTAAAVLGLGVGLGLLVLVRPFVETGDTPVVASVPESPAPIVAALPDAESRSAAPDGTRVNQALATLLADTPVSRSSPGRPAVIAEPGTLPVAPEAAAAEPVAAPEPPVVIRPPAGEAVAIARAPDFDAAESGPLAYGPAIPSYDPVRQQLLDAEEQPAEPAKPREDVAARAAADEEAAPTPAPARTGRATINSFVNMRAKPDNSATVVAMLAEGLSVKVIACDYWCEVEAGGKRGFVYKKFVSR